MTHIDVPEHADIIAAHDRIRPWIHRTPVLTSATLDRMSGATLAFKCEHLQKSGAFKARGATNAVLTLSGDEAGRGVATHSSGNHAAALCWAAACHGIRATAVMPEGVSRAKTRAVEAYGGEIVVCEASLAGRERTLAELLERTGACFIHPYDDARVIAGQATCAIELHEDAGPLDAVVAPIGGGGLIGGAALALATRSPATRVYAAEPANADDAHRSLRAGERLAAGAPDTVADGLRASLGELPWRLVSHHLSDVLLVGEDRIIDAMRLVWERMKVVIEPSSAVAVAAILDNPRLFAGQRVGVILTGGNVDLDRLPW